jgi:two-component system cell cycle sensor histidine kinase/response regulator CckA
LPLNSGLARIFDPYFTTKTQGRRTGLGLATVHGIVQRLGGSIHVYSEPGRGTTFQVYFPRLGRHAETLVETKAPLPTGCERILLVEDEPTVLEMMSETLSSLGYRVEGQPGPVEALLAFCIDSQRCDLVITDMNMPRKNGRELASELLAIRPDLPIIMCTGFSALMDDEAGAAAGIRAILLKPVLMQDMATTVRQVLDHDPTGSPECLEDGSRRRGDGLDSFDSEGDRPVNTPVDKVIVEETAWFKDLKNIEASSFGGIFQMDQGCVSCL